MTTLSVSDIVGLEAMPCTAFGVRKWLKLRAVPVLQDGKRFVFALSDLPPAVQRAVMERDIAASGLPVGNYDDAAHSAMMQATPATRAAAEAKAAIARDLQSISSRMSWSAKLAFIRDRHGAEGTSEASIARILRAVKGVDPINFAPALLADYARNGRPPVETSDVAWSFFLTLIRDGGAGFPLIQAWRDVRDAGKALGWHCSPYQTILRRWNALPEAQKLHARLGHEETVKALALPALRDKTTIKPLEWVSLDGRTKDFWAQNGDGKARRYTFLALVDCATSFILNWTLAESENARATLGLIKSTCEKYGVFDRLYPDNGAAFAGHLIAGGAVKRFRNSGTKLNGVKPLGICHHLGINLHFALPGNGQAKTAERTFASLSRVIDDRPEFKGAHSGHNPGAAPDSRVVPIHVDQARNILIREVARYNAEVGRKGQGMRGRSYQQAFEAGLASRVRRQPTARQLYLAGLIYTPVAVDRRGRVAVDNWTYGGPETQGDLLPYHKQGKVLLGRDPDNLGAPALAYNEEGHLICEGIEAVQRGAYGSVDGIRDAARNRKAARKTSREAEEANSYLIDAEFRACLGVIPTPDGPKTHPVAVVSGLFGGTLKTQKKQGNLAAPAGMTKADIDERDRALGIDWSLYAGTKAARQV